MANPHAITDNNMQRDQVAQAKQALAILEKHAPAIHEQVKREINGWESASLVFDAIKDATAGKLIAQYLRIKVGLAPKVVEKPEPERVTTKFTEAKPHTSKLERPGWCEEPIYSMYSDDDVIALLRNHITIKNRKHNLIFFSIAPKPAFIVISDIKRIHGCDVQLADIVTGDEPMWIHRLGGFIDSIEPFGKDDSLTMTFVMNPEQAKLRVNHIVAYLALKPALSEGTDTTQQEPAETPVAESVEAPAPVAEENAKDSAEIKVLPIQDLKVGDTFIWDKTSVKKPIRLTIQSIEYGEKGDPQHYNTTLPDGEFISMKLFVPSWKYQGKQVKVVRS